MQLAAEILSGGESSRLYQSIVYQQQIVQRVSFDAGLNQDLGLLTSRLILASGKSPADAEKSFNAQIDKVLKDGVTEAELAKAKNRFLTGKLLERETNNGKASALGEAAVIYGDPNRVNTDFSKLQAVTTGADQGSFESLPLREKESRDRILARGHEAGGGKERGEEIVMNTLLIPRALICHPEPAKRGEGPRGRSRVLPDRTRPARSLSVLRRIGMTTFALAVFSLTTSHSAWAIAGVDSPPAPSAKHETKFATPKEAKLENGLRVIVAERPGLPLLAAEVLVRNGAEVDPEKLAGTASMTGSLLTKGTETMSAPEIAQAIESLGGSIDSGAGWDSSAASVVVMSDKAERGSQDPGRRRPPSGLPAGLRSIG